MSKKAEKRPAARRASSSVRQTNELAGQTIWTPAMDKKARMIAADKQKSVDFLKRAGILNEQGNLAEEYAN